MMGVLFYDIKTASEEREEDELMRLIAKEELN